METDQLVDQTETIKGMPIKIIKRQTDIVPIVFEQFNQRVDLINVGSLSAMSTSPFYGEYSACAPPSEVRALIDYSRRRSLSNNLSSDNFFIFLDYLERINSMQEFYSESDGVYVYRNKTYRSILGFDLWKKSPHSGMHYCLGGDWLNWNTLHQRPKSKKVKKAARRINKNEAPLVLNVSLDGFYYCKPKIRTWARKRLEDIAVKVLGNTVRNAQALCSGRRKYLHYSMPEIMEPSPDEYIFIPEEVTQEQSQRRRQNFSSLIAELKRPDLIVLCESQKPIPTCPPTEVEHLEASILQILERELK